MSVSIGFAKCSKIATATWVMAIIVIQPTNIAVAEQRTGQLSMACQDPSNPANRRAFTIDYDRRTVVGIAPSSVVTFGAQEINWTRTAGDYTEIYRFSRDTGTLDWGNNNGQGATFVCEPGKNTRY
jgi:hypothetical protein